MAKQIAHIDVVHRKKLMRQQWFIVAGIVILSFSLGVFFGQGKLAITTKSSITGSEESQNKALPQDLDLSSVEELYDTLKQKFDGELSEDQILDGIRLGLAESAGDPYTTYFNPEESKEFDEDLNGSFEGIGAELSKEENVIIIVAPITGYPAEKAGLKARDIISSINDEDAFNLSVNDAVKKIRGEAGSEVKLGIIRDGKELSFTIKREKISIPSVTSKTLENNADIGYIQISRFGDDTTELTKQAAAELKAKGVTKIILDLRNNPGGYLKGAVDVASIWLPGGSVIVEEKRGGETIKKFTSSGDHVLQGIETVVLINEGSASASEIVAGALKDSGAAKIVGQTSFGKGSVQEIVPLVAGGSLKVTVARWFTPNGTTIEKDGIVPDVIAELPDDPTSTTDTQLKSAIDTLNQ